MSTLSTPDIDSRSGARRKLVDTYELHADHIDCIRVEMSESIRRTTQWIEDDIENSDYWAGALWEIDRTLRALGIED